MTFFFCEVQCLKVFSLEEDTCFQILKGGGKGDVVKEHRVMFHWPNSDL